MDKILLMLFFFFPFLFTLTFIQRSHQHVNREVGAILISAFAITTSSEKQGKSTYSLIMTGLFDSTGFEEARYLFTDFFSKVVRKNK